MNRMDLEKTKRLARFTRILCRITVWATAIGTALLAVTVLLACLVPLEHIKPLQESGKLSLNLSSGLYIPADVYASVDALRAFLKSMLARVGVSVAIYITVALHVMGLLKSVENGTPFEIQNVARLRKISVAIIIGSVLIPAVTGLAEMAVSGSSLLDIKSNSSIDITLLLCGILVLILSGVFAYGTRLQCEHDQTV